jgi:hypothetical protein
LALVVAMATNGPPLPDDERSIWKPVSLPELSFQSSSIWP